MAVTVESSAVRPPVTVALRGRLAALDTRAQVALLLTIHLLLWTWAGIASRSNLDLPGDMVEAFAWSQAFQWGYAKHPPLSAWIVGLWFQLMPTSDWAYSMLSALNAVVGLAGLAVLAREFLPRQGVLLCVAAATLTPGITTLAMRFNCNAVLVSTWPWAMALFVRLMQHGRNRDALLCGAVCALAMLGKYYSGTLVLTLLACSLVRADWRARWRSPAPWLALGTFALVMAPHLVWLLTRSAGTSPLDYAARATVPETQRAMMVRAVYFALAQWVYPALAFGLLWVSLDGPRRHRAWWQGFSAIARPRRDVVWMLAMVPILATMAGTLVTHARTTPLWGLPIACGVVLLVVHRALATGAALNARRMWTMLAVLWLVVGVLAPVWWVQQARRAAPTVAEPRQELAQALDTLWQREQHEPLRWVAGTRRTGQSVSFYLQGRARYWSVFNPAAESPWVDTARVQREGGLIVCDAGDRECEGFAEAWSAERQEIQVRKRERGFEFPARRFSVYTMRPWGLDSAAP